jgi:hypothetical protein
MGGHVSATRVDADGPEVRPEGVRRMQVPVVLIVIVEIFVCQRLRDVLLFVPLFASSLG